jgi:hypothetical protein
LLFLSITTPVAEGTVTVEGVLRRLAFEHRPPVAPPLLLPGPDVEVPRVSASAAVFSRVLLLGLGLELPSFLVDHDEMKPRRFEQARKIGDAYQVRLALSRHHYVPRHGGLERQFALT